MRYETINRVCGCGNTATYIYKDKINARDIRDHMDTMCDKCLEKLCFAQCTCMSEWEEFTEETFERRNKENGY